jgi:hypothetical protein
MLAADTAERLTDDKAEAALAEARVVQKAAIEEAAALRQEIDRRRSTGTGVWDVLRGRGRVSRRVEAAAGLTPKARTRAADASPIVSTPAISLARFGDGDSH